MLPRSAIAGIAFALAVCGCATPTREIRRHPQQARLEGLLEQVLPHTEYPEKHYWIRVSETSKDNIGLAVLPQRHIYLAEAVVAAADDSVLTALIVHAVAHHRLHHFNQREVAGLMQRAAFKAGGAFVPGLSHGHYVGGPITERFISPRQEASADRKTAEYLKKMGRPEEDFARALEFLAGHDLVERIGGTKSKANTLKNRAERIRKHA